MGIVFFLLSSLTLVSFNYNNRRLETKVRKQTTKERRPHPAAVSRQPSLIFFQERRKRKHRKRQPTSFAQPFFMLFCKRGRPLSFLLDFFFRSPGEPFPGRCDIIRAPPPMSFLSFHYCLLLVTFSLHLLLKVTRRRQ